MQTLALQVMLSYGKYLHAALFFVCQNCLDSGMALGMQKCIKTCGLFQLQTISTITGAEVDKRQLWEAEILQELAEQRDIARRI